MKRLILFFSMCALWAGIVTAQTTNSASGRCTGDIEWTFDGRTLYINNTTPKKALVEMPDYDMTKNIAPWIKQKLSMRKVVQ